MDYSQIISGVLQGLTLAAVTAIGGALARFAKKWTSDYETLKDSQRQDQKAAIVEVYQRAVQRGHITPLELDATLRRFDAYKALGGNTYVETLVERLKNEMPIEGEGIPEH